VGSTKFLREREGQMRENASSPQKKEAHECGG